MKKICNLVLKFAFSVSLLALLYCLYDGLFESNTLALERILTPEHHLKIILFSVLTFFLSRSKLSNFILKKSIEIDPKEPLHKVPLFWLASLSFILPAVILSIPFMCFCYPDKNNYDELIKQLGFPVLIASFAFPFSISVARFHSSKQVAAKIKIDESNESFKIFFEHKKIFISKVETKLKDLPPEGSTHRSKIQSITVENYDKLYGVVFQDSSYRRLNTLPTAKGIHKTLLDAIHESYSLTKDYLVNFNDTHLSKSDFTNELCKIFLNEYKEIILKGIGVWVIPRASGEDRFLDVVDTLMYQFPKIVFFICEFELTPEEVSKFDRSLFTINLVAPEYAFEIKRLYNDKLEIIEP